MGRLMSSVSPTFTLNYGMRWEYFGPLSEKHNLLSNLGQDGNLAMVGTDGLHGAYNLHPVFAADVENQGIAGDISDKTGDLNFARGQRRRLIIELGGHVIHGLMHRLAEYGVGKI